MGVFLTRLNNIKDKVYIDIEFISNLFPQNKYIGIIGSSYNITINSLINNMFSNVDRGFLDKKTIYRVKKYEK